MAQRAGRLVVGREWGRIGSAGRGADRCACRSVRRRGRGAATGGAEAPARLPIALHALRRWAAGAHLADPAAMAKKMPLRRRNLWRYLSDPLQQTEPDT